MERDLDQYQESNEQSLFSGLAMNLPAASALILEPADFSHPDHWKLFQILQDFGRQGMRAFNRRLLHTEFVRRFGQAQIDWGDLFSASEKSWDLPVLERFAKNLRELSARREYDHAYRENTRLILDMDRDLDSVVGAHALALAGAQAQIMRDIDPSAVGIRKRAMAITQTNYFPSGLEAVDQMVKGFKPGHLWVLSAPYKSRKTTTALNVVASQLREGRSVMYIALEDTDVAFFDMLTAVWSGQPYFFCESGSHNEPAVQAQIDRARDEIAASPLRIYDAKKGVHNYRKLPELVASDALRFGKPDLVVLDYVQAYSTKYDDLAEITPLLLRIAGEKEVAILALSQMNNNDIRSPQSTEGVLLTKGTGDLGANCHVGLEIRRDPNIPAELQLSVKIARHGTPGQTFVLLDPPSGQFLGNARSATFLKHMDLSDVIAEAH